jgi:RNA polymerase sigma factor (TIGR02999 family)
VLDLALFMSYSRQQPIKSAVMSNVTRLLDVANRGDRQAAADLLPLVYDELRKLAAAKMSRESPCHTLDATALVHEAYLRLVGDQKFDERGHFFAAAAEAMRRILVESARRKSSRKRGGDWMRQPLDEAEIPLQRPPEEMLAMHDALNQLAAKDMRAAELVKLRYFVGMTLDEAAKALGISSRTADGVWAYARAWLLVQFDPST